MRLHARRFLWLASIAVAAGSFGLSAASRSEKRDLLTDRQRAIHALNRLGFGPRPGDVERLLETGVRSWIGQQLHPESIPDPIPTQKLRDLPTLAMSTAELFEKFERPVREAVRQRREDAKGAEARAGAQGAAADLEKVRARLPFENRPRRIIEELSAARVLRAAYSERQFNEVMVDFWMNHFNVFGAKGLDRIFITAFERDTIRPNLWGRFEDLLAATAKSPAMLFYLDNARSTADPANRRARRALGARPWALGEADLEMQAQAGNAPTGLNENYARELMELQTLGVDGGYTQKDVTELARVLTGWSIDRRGGEPGGFLFRRAVHDVGEKAVLGQRFPAGGGIEEGERMLSILARHPSTARHIARQLCQRLVADEPGSELVDRVARVFLATGGDLRQTVRAIVESPEFFDPKFYRAKVKSPFEYVVSAVRAAGADTDGRMPIVRPISQMGEPLYLCQPPTGYSDAASAWVNTGALVARLNFALDLAANRLPGTHVDLARLVTPEEAADPKKSIEALSRALTGADLTPETRQAIDKRLEDRPAPLDDPSANTQLPLVAGLILGSPEFQKQ